MGQGHDERRGEAGTGIPVTELFYLYINGMKIKAFIGLVGAVGLCACQPSPQATTVVGRLADMGNDTLLVASGYLFSAPLIIVYLPILSPVLCAIFHHHDITYH